MFDYSKSEEANLRLALIEANTERDEAFKARDLCAATARALRSELQKVETLWSTASRERNDAVALLRIFEESAFLLQNRILNIKHGEDSALQMAQRMAQRFQSNVDRARAFLSRIDAKSKVQS